MTLRIDIDPNELRPIIDQAVDAAVQRLKSERPADEGGRVLLTTAEAAKALGASQSTVDRMRREGNLPSVKLDGLVLFRPDSLDAWAKTREVTA